MKTWKDMDVLGLIGQTVMVRAAEFWVPMIVVNVKQPYGVLRYLVHPVNGHGEAWIETGRIRVIE